MSTTLAQQRTAELEQLMSAEQYKDYVANLS